MARRLLNRASKRNIEAPEFITPYAAPAPNIAKVKLSLILLVLTGVRLVVLIIFCLPWSIHNLVVIYHPRSGVRRQMYWSTGLKLEPLFMPVQFSGGYNTDKFREIVSYIYIVDFFLEVILAPLIFLMNKLGTIRLLCIIWLIWGIGSLGLFSWGYARFVIRKQFRMTIYYLDFGFILVSSIFLIIQIVSLSSLIKVGYITFPATSRRSFRRQNMVVPKNKPEEKKTVTMKDDKDLVEVLGGNSGPDTPAQSQTPTTPITTATTSVEPSSESAIATPNTGQDQQGYGNYDPYYGAYGQYPPPYGSYPPPGYPGYPGPGPGPYGYPPNYQQPPAPQPTAATTQSLEVPSTASTQPTPQLTKAEPTPEPSRAASVVPSTMNPTTTTTTTGLPTPYQQHPPHIVSVGPNPYELQAMLERLMPRERPTNTTLTEISISRKKKKKDKKKKKKKSKHKKRK
ncbi:unnamed protein product [Orchesella dallaii]|uniref:Uncharacterized protein n=1 Tax=Orchesella dallaii TaxID=48710 RepID=A0ABP1PMJ8_9HEXA